VAVPEAFHTSVYVKTGGEVETARRLATVRRRGEAIAIGAATDPYQPGEGDYGVTRRFLELVAQQRGLRLSITTKGALILRDLELLERIQQRSSLQGPRVADLAARRAAAQDRAAGAAARGAVARDAAPGPTRASM
jgi:hypothetical protein